MQVIETIVARGHENILATHESTLEITTERRLSEKGNCIIAIAADKSMDNLSSKFKGVLCKENAKITIQIEAGNEADVVYAFGSERLILAHPTDIVIRKGDYISNRTLAIHADKAACDLSRTLAEKLKNPKQTVKITLTVTI